MRPHPLSHASILLVLALLPPALAADSQGPSPPAGTQIARWNFDDATGGSASDASGAGLTAKVLNPVWGQGKTSGALVLDDYSLKDYLKPDVRLATKAIVPHGDRLNPASGLVIRATVFPTRDPLYYGGIVEKGRGYGASYRLVLLRGLRVRAAFGPGHVSATSEKPITLDAWHEIEARWEGGAIVLRIDGAEAGRAQGAKGLLASKDDLVIGDRFSGRIDEISLSAP